MNPILPTDYGYMWAIAGLSYLVALITPVALIWIVIELRAIRKRLDSDKQ